MWLKLVEFGKQLFNLKSQTEQNTSDIKDLQQKVQELTVVVRKLTQTIQRDRENRIHEVEKLQLRLENALLKVERRFLLGSQNAQQQDEEV